MTEPERHVSNAVHGAVHGPVLQVGTVAGDVNPMEQLLTLLSASLPPFLTEATRGAHLR